MRRHNKDENKRWVRTHLYAMIVCVSLSCICMRACICILLFSFSYLSVYYTDCYVYTKCIAREYFIRNKHLIYINLKYTAEIKLKRNKYTFLFVL